jgi:hypothetical protein
VVVLEVTPLGRRAVPFVGAWQQVTRLALTARA